MDPFRAGYPDEPKTPPEFANQLRRDASMPERILWRRVRGRQFLDLKFRRQHPLGSYVADFYCDELRLVVEIDGSDHYRRRERDAARDAWMHAQGIRVIRVFAAAVSVDVDAVLRYLRQEIERQQGALGSTEEKWRGEERSQ